MNFCFRHLSNGMLQRITRWLSVIQTLTWWKILRKAKKSLSIVCFLKECQEYSGFNKVCLKMWLHWLCAKCTMCTKISSKIEALPQSAVSQIIKVYITLTTALGQPLTQRLPGVGWADWPLLCCWISKRHHHGGGVWVMVDPSRQQSMHTIHMLRNLR